MRRLASSALAGAILLLGGSSAKAEDLTYDFWGLTDTTIPGLPTFEETPLLDGFERSGAYLYNSDTGSVLQISDQEPTDKSPNSFWIVDPATKKLYIPSDSNGGGRAGGYFHVLDPVTKTWSKECEGDNTFDWSRVCDVRIPDGGFSVDTSANTSISIGDSDNPTVLSSSGMTDIVKKNSDGSIQIGTDTNDIDITSEGLSIDGNPLITKKADGNIHIGKNSLITPEEHSTLSDGTTVHHLWAEDDTETKIPINIHGSKLLIDGVEVTAGDSEQVTTNKNNITTNTSNISTNTSNITTNKSNINDLGQGVANATALTAALTALPQASTDSKLSCGVGTGTYSSSYAFGVGCASKVNEKVDINFGGSYVGGGSKDYGSGSLDTVAARAGFIFKLGKITKPTLISMKEKKVLQSKVEDLAKSNKNIKNENQELKNLLAIQNQRLEKLEQIALGHFNSKELVSSLQ